MNKLITPPHTQFVVSIIIITYNSSNFVLETLESILNQDFDLRNIEVIISDDCSRDNTPELCNNCIKENANKFRRAIFTQTSLNKGIAANYNNALKHSRGEWIKFIAGDDRLKPYCISTFVKNISPKDDILCCYWETFKNDKDFIKVESHNQLKDRDNQLKNILRNRPFQIVHGPTLFIRRNYLLQNDGFDERFMFSEDYPLCIKYLINGGKIKQIDRPLVEYRCYPESVSGQAKPAFVNSLYGAMTEYLPKAALKINSPTYWYHYKLIGLELKGFNTNKSGKLLLYFLRTFDIYSYKRFFKKLKFKQKF